MLSEPEIRRIAAIMLDELRQQKLTVAVIPDGRPNSHRGIRVPVVSNPDWYSRLCQQYTSPRKNPRMRHRTIIKRGCTYRHLMLIAAGYVRREWIYHQRLLDAIEWLANTRDCGELANGGGLGASHSREDGVFDSDW